MPTIKVHPNLAAFLDLIAWSEGTSTQKATKDDGYDVIVDGVDGLHNFTDYSTHPFTTGRPSIIVRAAFYRGLAGETSDISAATIPIVCTREELRSTASGRYQIELETWTELARTLHLGTFNPNNQDLAAWQLITRCRATEYLLRGRVVNAIEACNEIWASFPGNLYSQGGKNMADLLTNYEILLRAQTQ